MRYKITKGLENAPLAAKIREQVFIGEQGFKNEFDEIDTDAWHVVIFVDGKAAATGRLFIDNSGTAHIGRVAVLKAFRRQNLGSFVVAALEKKAFDLGYTQKELSAQLQAFPFYEKHGYSPVGEEYLDEHCPHIRMIKKMLRN